MKNVLLSTRLAVNLRVLFCLLMLPMACMVHAQVAGTGNIQGSVVDATGAVIPNATITLTNASTQVKRMTKSDSSGAYVSPISRSALMQWASWFLGSRPTSRAASCLKSAAALP